MSHEPGAIHAALAAGYRVVVHKSFFPYEALDPASPGTTRTVHAEVDHGARAIFCSQEWFDKSRKVSA
jgi:hypothetical protein